MVIKNTLADLNKEMLVKNQIKSDWNKLNNYLKKFKGTWEDLKEKLDLSTSGDENVIDIYYGCFEGTIHNENGIFILSRFIDVINANGTVTNFIIKEEE